MSSSDEDDDDYSGSEEDEYDEEDDEEEDDEEEDEAEEEAEPAAAVDVDQDLALIRECSARMDDTFARLLLRYPPARSTSSGRAGGSRPSAAGGAARDTGTRDGGWPGETMSLSVSLPSQRDKSPSCRAPMK